MNWIFFALAGSVAQLIDGTLGMGFGLTSSTLLLTLGDLAGVERKRHQDQRVVVNPPRCGNH